MLTNAFVDQTFHSEAIRSFHHLPQLTPVIRKWRICSRLTAPHFLRMLITVGFTLHAVRLELIQLYHHVSCAVLVSNTDFWW